MRDIAKTYEHLKCFNCFQNKKNFIHSYLFFVLPLRNGFGTHSERERKSKMFYSIEMNCEWKWKESPFLLHCNVPSKRENLYYLSAHHLIVYIFFSLPVAVGLVFCVNFHCIWDINWGHTSIHLTTNEPRKIKRKARTFLAPCHIVFYCLARYPSENEEQNVLITMDIACITVARPIT